MSDEYGVDLEEVFKVIDNAEVLVVRFHIIQKRLLVDFRTKLGVGPFIGLVPRAESVEDRFRSIKRLRPEFAFPEKVMSFHWPRSIQVLVDCGVWQHLADRMVTLGDDQGGALVTGALEILQREERAEVAEAIRGSKHYQTLWARRA